MAYTAIQQQMHAGDLTSCIQRIEKELKKDKNEAQWYWLLDDVYLKQSRHDQRIAILQKGLKQKKTHWSKIDYATPCHCLFW